MYFQLVESQALSTRGQPDVFNLHRLTAPAAAYDVPAFHSHPRSSGAISEAQEVQFESTVIIFRIKVPLRA